MPMMTLRAGMSAWCALHKVTMMRSWTVPVSKLAVSLGGLQHGHGLVRAQPLVLRALGDLAKVAEGAADLT